MAVLSAFSRSLSSQPRLSATVPITPIGRVHDKSAAKPMTRDDVMRLREIDSGAEIQDSAVRDCERCARF